jgi:hypothetical protein
MSAVSGYAGYNPASDVPRQTDVGSSTGLIPISSRLACRASQQESHSHVSIAPRLAGVECGATAPRLAGVELLYTATFGTPNQTHIQAPLLQKQLRLLRQQQGIRCSGGRASKVMRKQFLFQ